LSYVIVQNQFRGESFDLEKSPVKEQADALNAKVVPLKRLHQAVIASIDAENSSFWAAQQKNGGGPGLGSQMAVARAAQRRGHRRARGTAGFT
jgi:hypothetical protein